MVRQRFSCCCCCWRWTKNSNIACSNALATFVPSFALNLNGFNEHDTHMKVWKLVHLVSRNGMFHFEANTAPSSVLTFLVSARSSMVLFSTCHTPISLPTKLSTAFPYPTNTIGTIGNELLLIMRMSSFVFSSYSVTLVISNTTTNKWNSPVRTKVEK